jgi:hypothetical protein
MGRRVAIAALLLSLAAAVGCGDDFDSEADSTTTLETDALSTDIASTELIGSWHRAQTCAEMLAAFQQAGLAESQVEWLQGNFFGGEPGPTEGYVCQGAFGPLEHDHLFTAAGAFGSHDEAGEEVDSEDVELVDDDTVSFPSHAAEFGYDGDLVGDYTVSGDVVTFDVALPGACVDAGTDAYAWALSAFPPARGSAAKCREVGRWEKACPLSS